MNKSIHSILIVDDDYATNKYNKIIIEEAGFTGEVWEANNGAQALKILKDIPNFLLDVILLDLNMPVTNGWEFLDALQEPGYPDLSNTVIYILSASRNPDDIERARQYDIVKGFISKPLEVSEVIEKIIKAT